MPHSIVMRAYDHCGHFSFCHLGACGNCVSRWHEYRTPLLQPFIVSELLFVSTVGPLAGAVLAAPLTVVVVITFAIMVFFGSRSKRIWLSLSAFVLMGLYWLLMVELIRQFALMD
jgi:hypothetical protein